MIITKETKLCDVCGKEDNNLGELCLYDDCGNNIIKIANNGIEQQWKLYNEGKSIQICYNCREDILKKIRTTIRSNLDIEKQFVLIRDGIIEELTDE